MLEPKMLVRESSYRFGYQTRDYDIFVDYTETTDLYLGVPYAKVCIDVLKCTKGIESREDIEEDAETHNLRTVKRWHDPCYESRMRSSVSEFTKRETVIKFMRETLDQYAADFLGIEAGALKIPEVVLKGLTY